MTIQICDLQKRDLISVTLKNPDAIKSLKQVHSRLRQCRQCPQMCSEPVHGPAFETPILLVGQAPGAHESSLGRPFAYTAGKTLFKWLGSVTGLSEEELREQIYFSAVARCFPGKSKSGSGDREPSDLEIENCRGFLKDEVKALQPQVILAVGKVAIREVLAQTGYRKTTPLADVVGLKIRTQFHGHEVDVIPLPHPSGVSRWPQTEPGKSKLAQALKLVGREFKRLQNES